MTLHYLFVDRDNQLRLIPREHVEAIWRGQASAAELARGALTELRLVSVLCDRRLLPRRIYLLRMSLTDGWFTRSNFRALRSHAMPSRVTAQEMFLHHGEGWPRDFFTQLAVALDVPRARLDVPFGIGGPPLVAAALRGSPPRAAPPPR